MEQKILLAGTTPIQIRCVRAPDPPGSGAVGSALPLADVASTPRKSGAGLRARLARWLALAFAFALISVAAFIPVAQGQTGTPQAPFGGAKNILILYSYGHGSREIDLLDDNLIQALNNGGVATNNLFIEHLDLERNRLDSQYLPRLQAFLTLKYAATRIDLIITVQQPALNFLLDEGAQLSPKAPAITIGAPAPTPEQAGKRSIVSLLSNFDIEGTIDLALDIFPHTRRVLFVSGSSASDRQLAASAAPIAAQYHGRLAFEYTTDLSMEALLKKVANLPPDTIILFSQHNRDAFGRITVSYEVERMITKVSNTPVFGLWNFNLRDGGIGGSVVGIEQTSEAAGRVALEILNGTMKLTAPVTPVRIETYPLIDWQQLKRWNGEGDRLAPNTVFANRNPEFWDRNWAYGVALAVFLVAQSILVIGLLISRHRKIRAATQLQADIAEHVGIESGLRESEGRLMMLLDNLNAAIYIKGTDYRYVYANKGTCELLGKRLDEVLGHVDSDLVDATMAAQLLLHDREVLVENKRVSIEEPFVDPEGNARLGRVVRFPLHDSAGRVCGLCGIATDITKLKRIEAELDKHRSGLERMARDNADKAKL